MNSSDIIAVVAIVVTGVVSVISAYTSYQNNKANIVAKRSEMVLEKRLDAFNRVVEKFGRIDDILTYEMADYIHNPNQSKVEEKRLLNKYWETHRDARNELGSQLIFFPFEISNIINDYYNDPKLVELSNEFFKNKDIASLQGLRSANQKWIKKLILSIQKNIGI